MYIFKLVLNLTNIIMTVEPRDSANKISKCLKFHSHIRARNTQHAQYMYTNLLWWVFEYFHQPPCVRDLCGKRQYYGIVHSLIFDMRVLWYFQRNRNWNNEVRRDDLYFIQDALKEFSPSFFRVSYGNPCDSNGFHTRDFRLCFRLRHEFLRARNITRWRNNCALLSVSLSRLKFSSLFFCSEVHTIRTLNHDAFLKKRNLVLTCTRETKRIKRRKLLGEVED